MVSDPINIARGTKYVCPLLYFFHLQKVVNAKPLVEPLANIIRTGPNIRGTGIEGQNYVINLFADDIAIKLSKPVISHIF